MPSPNLSIGEIAVSIRVATSAEDAMLDPDISFLVASIAAGVTPILDDYTTAAPQDTANLALTRMVQAVYDSEPALRGNFADFFVVSGAKALLSRYRTQTSAVV